MAGVHPSSTRPSTFATGTRTLVKKTSLNPESPESIRRGRTVTPSLFMSTSRHVMPLCLGASGLVRTSSMHQSATWAIAGPDLLAIDDERVARQHGAGSERRQVAPRVGLGEALAPDMFAREDGGREPPFLILGAERDDRRADQSLADGAEPLGSVGARQLFVVDRLLDHRGAAASGLFGPGDTCPAPLEQRSLPGAEVLEVRPPPLGIGRALRSTAQASGRGAMRGARRGISVRPGSSSSPWCWSFNGPSRTASQRSSATSSTRTSRSPLQ